jgi:energy-coupling factor transporter transmembrane protein EcfT
MKQRKLLILSIASSVLVILYEFFQWRIIDIVTEFLIFPIWLIVFGFFIVITVRAVIHLFKNKDWKPVSIQVLTVLLLFFFPFTEIILDIDFKTNKSEREKVTKMVENGTLKSNVSYNSSLILLPKKYQHLSKGGGEIEIEKTDKGYFILFFTYRGILDNFSGFVYSSNDQKPSKNTFDGDFKQIEKLEEKWYWVGSY